MRESDRTGGRSCTVFPASVATVLLDSCASDAGAPLGKAVWPSVWAAEVCFDVRGRMLGTDFVRSEALRLSLLKAGELGVAASLSDSLPAGTSNFGMRAAACGEENGIAERRTSLYPSADLPQTFRSAGSVGEEAARAYLEARRCCRVYAREWSTTRVADLQLKRVSCGRRAAGIVCCALQSLIDGLLRLCLTNSSRHRDCTPPNRNHKHASARPAEASQRAVRQQH